LQARHLDLATASFQRRAVLRVMLGVPGFNVQTQPGDFFTYLDAEWAGLELIQGEVLTGLIADGLLFSTASDAFGRAEFFAEQHKWRQDKAPSAENITNTDSHGSYSNFGLKVTYRVPALWLDLQTSPS